MYLGEPHIQDLQHDPPSARIFAATKSEFAAALRILTHHEKALLASWKQQLAGFWGLAESHGADPEIALWHAVQRIPAIAFEDFQQDIGRIGEDLARREIALARVLATIEEMQDAASQLIAQEHQEEAVAFERMSSLAVAALVSAYAIHWEARAHANEGRLKDAEQRLLKTSSYVTGFYERERRRLSHDLHDEIGHELIVLKLRMELIAADVNQDKLALLAPRLNDALELVGHAIDSVRRLVMDLGPAVFDDLGFLPAIRLYARQFNAGTGIEVAVRERDIPNEIALSHQTALYRVLQGALSNVLRHAHAKHVTVSFARLNQSELRMTIEDDGVGFDAAGARSWQGFGLTAMRERIAVLGGTVLVESWPASPLGGRRGTRIQVDLPLAGAEAP